MRIKNATVCTDFGLSVHAKFCDVDVMPNVRGKMIQCCPEREFSWGVLVYPFESGHLYLGGTDVDNMSEVQTGACPFWDITQEDWGMVCDAIEIAVSDEILAINDRFLGMQDIMLELVTQIERQSDCVTHED